MNHYEVLGVPRDADAARIRRAYLAAARAHHPDFHARADERVRAEAARQMQAVNEAWSILGDPSRRASYDRHLPAARAGRPSAATPSGRRTAAPPPGKGWTPRRDDDGWQRDFGAWRDVDERLAEDPPGPVRRLVLTLPVLLVLAGFALLLTGAALSSRGLLAVAFVSFAIAAILFVMLPVLEMTRGRHRS